MSEPTDLFWQEEEATHNKQDKLIEKLSFGHTTT